MWGDGIVLNLKGGELARCYSENIFVCGVDRFKNKEMRNEARTPVIYYGGGCRSFTAKHSISKICFA